MKKRLAEGDERPNQEKTKDVEKPTETAKTAPAKVKSDSPKPTKEVAPAPTGKAESSPRSPSSGHLSSESDTGLILTTTAGCFVVQFSAPAGQILSCTEPLPITYTQRVCSDGKVQEIGKVDAVVVCEEAGRVQLRFRASKEVIAARLQSRRSDRGRAGVATEYRILSAGTEQSAYSRFLPEPELQPLEEAKPEESPLRWKVQGFAWVEHERTAKFGFDQGVTNASGTVVQSPQANFTSNGPQPRQSNSNFFANFGVEAGKDRTNLVSLFEVGEVYFGDTSSGGAQGTRAGNIFEVRNLFLDHEVSKSLSIRGGLITTASDPRSFIFNDHIGSIAAAFKTDLSEGSFWYGNASQNRPAAQALQDSYMGLNGTLGFLSGIKGSAFAVYRARSGERYAVQGASGLNQENTDTESVWLGGTFETDAKNALSGQVTLIGNSNSVTSGSQKSSYQSYLLDIKGNYSLSERYVLSLEGLSTPGAKDARDTASGNPILGKRRAFVSPVGVSYLLSVATSDGADDAPGTPKQSTIANLGLEEGLRIAVATLNFTVSRKTSALLRFGYLASAESSATTDSNEIGQEIDAQLIHNLTPTMSLQLDYGYFTPGPYFSNREAAELIALRTKFSF